MGMRFRLAFFAVVLSVGIAVAWIKDRQRGATQEGTVGQPAAREESPRQWAEDAGSYEAPERRVAVEKLVKAGSAAVAPCIARFREPYLDVDCVNALVEALSRIGAPAVEPMLAVVAGPDVLAADRCARALGRIRDAPADAALAARIQEAVRPAFPLKIRIKRTESDYERQKRDAEAKAKTSYGPVLYEYQIGLMHEIGEISADPADVKELVALLSEGNPNARDALAGQVADLQPRLGKELLDALVAALEPDPTASTETRPGALLALGKIGPDAGPAVPSIVALVEKEGSSEAMEALRKIGPGARAAVPALRKAAKGEWADDAYVLDRPQSARAALETLGALGPAAAEAVPDLIAMLRDVNLQQDAARALGGIGAAARDAIPAFEALEKELAPRVEEERVEIERERVRLEREAGETGSLPSYETPASEPFLNDVRDALQKIRGR